MNPNPCNLTIVSRYLPESCVLIIVGIVIGLIIYSGSEYDHRIKGSEDHENRIVYFPSFTADLFFNVLLPPIILGKQIKSSCCRPECCQCQKVPLVTG